MAIGKTNAQNKSTNYWQVQKIEDASFHFKKNDSGYWVNTNAATGSNNANTAAVCRVFFRMAQADKITFTINQDSESRYDYGIIGTLDTDDDTILKSFQNVSGTETFTTNIPKGEHFVYIKYRKDSSASNGTDTFQFTITSGATEIESEDGVDVSGVTATAADVLSGETFINAEGELLPGTMTNNSTLTTKALTYNSSDKKFYIPYGFYDGNQVATSSQITAIASDVLSGETFMNSSGALTTGTMTNNATELYKALDLSNNQYYIPEGYYDGNQAIWMPDVTATAGAVVKGYKFVDADGALQDGAFAMYSATASVNLTTNVAGTLTLSNSNMTYTPSSFMAFCTQWQSSPYFCGIVYLGSSSGSYVITNGQFSSTSYTSATVTPTFSKGKVVISINTGNYNIYIANTGGWAGWMW